MHIKHARRCRSCVKSRNRTILVKLKYNNFPNFLTVTELLHIFWYTPQVTRNSQYLNQPSLKHLGRLCYVKSWSCILILRLPCHAFLVSLNTARSIFIRKYLKSFSAYVQEFQKILNGQVWNLLKIYWRYHSSHKNVLWTTSPSEICSSQYTLASIASMSISIQTLLIPFKSTQVSVLSLL